MATIPGTLSTTSSAVIAMMPSPLQHNGHYALADQTQYNDHDADVTDIQNVGRDASNLIDLATILVMAIFLKTHSVMAMMQQTLLWP